MPTRNQLQSRDLREHRAMHLGALLTKARKDDEAERIERQLRELDRAIVGLEEAADASTTEQT